MFTVKSIITYTPTYILYVIIIVICHVRARLACRVYQHNNIIHSCRPRREYNIIYNDDNNDNIINQKSKNLKKK